MTGACGRGRGVRCRLVVAARGVRRWAGWWSLWGPRPHARVSGVVWWMIAVAGGVAVAAIVAAVVAAAGVAAADAGVYDSSLLYCH